MAPGIFFTAGFGKADSHIGHAQKEPMMSETEATTTARNGALLHKRHATVHTARIDVKIMRVGKKQVTMGAPALR
jgi:hypothetical protein